MVGLPLTGRKYTWYREDGLTVNRLGIFLVSEEWIQQWLYCTLWCLPKNLLDHCVIILWRRRYIRDLNLSRFLIVGGKLRVMNSL